MLLSLILSFTQNGSAEQLQQNEQEQAMSLASQIAMQKNSYEKTDMSKLGSDVSALLDKGYDAWANLQFEKAKAYFKAALDILPNDPEITDLIFDLEKSQIVYERGKIKTELSILKQKRMLDTDKAWLTDAPPGVALIEDQSPSRSAIKRKANKKDVSVDFNDAKIANILEFLSKMSGINIIMNEEAVARAGTISIHLKNVSLVQALESVLRTKGLNYRFEKDFIWVSSQSDIANENLVTRIYNLSQGLATFTSFTTFDTVTVEGMRGDNRIVLGEPVNDDEEAANAPGVRTYEGVKVGGPSGVAGKITMTIEDVLKQVIDWPSGSRIFLDNRTSKLIVRNTPTNLALLEQVIEALDVNPPQVMIEARFVEIGEDDLFSLGLKINGSVSGSGAASPTSFPFNKNENGKYNSAFPTPTTDEFTFGTLDFSEFQAVISAIENNTDTNTLSSPKITTISGQEAVIKIVKEYRYPTKYEIEVLRVEDADGNTVTQSFPVPVEFTTRDIGIILKVTPNVGADQKTINLTVIPEVSEFDEDDDFFNYGTDERPFLQPFFNTRNATASLIVNNNETVVMGGLMRETVEKGVDRVPILGSIPLLGNIFSRKVDNTLKRNLLIFVTARIMNPNGQTAIKQQ
jgi:general secretion pathway protein D